MLSLWRDNVCAGSFRLAVDEVPDLIDAAARRPRRGVRRRAAAARAGRRPAPERPRRVSSRNLRVTARDADTVPIVDPIRNPYAPGAGQRPPELAGRDEQLGAFDVVLERVARGRPERCLVLTGLRGVGKTVLLNALRSAAVRRHWGTGKLEARPDQALRRPLVERAAPGGPRARPPARPTTSTTCSA